MGSVVEGDQRPLDGFAECPVLPDARSHGQQPVGDPGVQVLDGPAAVPFEVELALEGVVDRFVPLPDPAQGAVPGVSSLRSRRTGCSLNPVATRSSNSRLAKPLSPMRIRPGRSAPVRAAWASSSPATSRSPIFGSARHHVTGIRSGVVIRYSYSIPVPARMRGAVPVVLPPVQLGPPYRLPGGAARHRGRVDQPHRVVPRLALPGQVIHHGSQQRCRCFEPLVVAGLMRQIGEQVAQPGSSTIRSQ